MMDSNKGKSLIAKNYIYNLCYRIFTIITPLITTPYISRILGPENIGIYGFSAAICLYFIIIGNLGFPLYGQREIAYTSNDKEKMSNSFFEIMSGKMIILVIALIAYISYILVFVSEYHLIYFAQAIGLVADIINVGWFYQGIENFKITITRNFFIKIFTIICIFCFVKNVDDLLVYTLIINIGNLIGNAIVIPGLRKYLIFKKNRISFGKIFNRIKYALILAIPYYVSSIYVLIDKTMLGFLCSDYAQVGYYEQSQKIVTFALSIVTAVGVVLMPRIANKVSTNDEKSVSYYLNKGIEVILMLSLPIMGGLIVVSDMLVPWFFGEGYESVGTLILIFSSLALSLGLSNFIGNQYFVAAKKEKYLTITIGIGIVVNILMNVILIPKYYAYGAAFATIISEFVKLIVQFIFARKEIEIKKMIIPLLKYLVFSIVMTVSGYLLKIYVFIDFTIINTALVVLICSVLYFLALLLSKNEFVFAFINKFFKKAQE